LGDFIRVCALDSVPQGGILGIDVRGKRILLTNPEGEIFAFDAICTHEKADLSEGTINGRAIECPLHRSEFDLRTGEALTPPAEAGLKKFNVKIEDGAIFIEL
jgi:3-phenylpropionate/trans-cinnamate dioxygenase ferredoxin subunit